MFGPEIAHTTFNVTQTSRINHDISLIMLYNCWKENNWGLLDYELSCDGWIQLNYALIQSVRMDKFKFNQKNSLEAVVFFHLSGSTEVI